MGANAQTTVPDFVADTVLTAAKLDISAATGVPVFATTVTRDAAFGGANKVLAQGQLCYLEATNVLQFYNGAAWASVGAGMITKVELFKSGGTFTPPTDATFAIATMVGGGGGTGTASSGTGGTSSVAFAAGTITAIGGLGIVTFITSNQQQSAGTANSGNGGITFGTGSGSATTENSQATAQSGAQIIAGGVVTAGVGITVTVGAAGAAGTGGAAGGSGYVSISYQVPA